LRRRPVLPIARVFLGLLGLAAFAAGALVLAEIEIESPIESDDPPGPLYVTLDSSSTSLSRPVTIIVDDTRDAEIPTRASGLVTSVRAGSIDVSGGEVVAHLDGQPLWLFESRQPFWRDLKRGSEGSDVLMLCEFLVKMSVDPSPEPCDERFGSRVEAALASFNSSLGFSDGDRKRLQYRLALFVPLDTISAITVTLKVGEEVAPGTIAARSELLSATVRIVDDSPAAHFALGEQQLDAGGSAIPYPMSSRLFGPAGAELARDLGLTDDGSISAVASLRQPVTLSVVPSSAFVHAGNCLAALDESGELTPVVVEPLFSLGGATRVLDDLAGVTVLINPLDQSLSAEFCENK